MCVCVRARVCYHLFVWLGLFMCTLIRYLGFMFVVVFFNCVVGCFSMIVWTPAVLSLICMWFVFLYLPLCSGIEHVSHGKALYI